MKKFYPSSSAFMLGDVVMTKYDSGCLRSILIKSHKIKTGEIPALYKRIGAVHEDRVFAELQADTGNLAVQREVVIKKPLSAEVEYSGRLDFRTFRKNSDEPIVHEAKGTVSKNTRRDLRKRIYNVSYLAQLISYMCDLRTTRGKLVCGYYEEDDSQTPAVLVETERHVFKVTIGETGRIDVDGEPSGYNANDLLAHRRAAVRALERNEIGPRPDKWNQKWGGPCGNCAFNDTCTKQDNGEFSTTEEFLASARVAAEIARNTVREEPTIFKVKKPKETKNGKGSKKSSSSGSSGGDASSD